MCRRLLWRALALVVSVTAASSASAQIVNTQPLVGKAAGDGLTGELVGALDWRTGNVDLIRASSSLLMIYRTGYNTLISSSSGEYGIKSGEVFISSVFSHLRYQRWLSDLVTLEAFGQVSTSRFNRLNLRALGGLGPRWTLLPGPAVSAALGTAYMFEHEVLKGGSTTDSGRIENNHRLSIYLSGRFELDPLITFVHTTFYQPRLDAFADDFRLLSETSLVLKFSDAVAVAVQFKLAYDHEPPIDVEELDTTLLFSIAWGFTS